MAKLKPHYKFILWTLVFVVYAFLAARPVPKETVFTLRWLQSLDTSYETALDSEVFPFRMGDRFGYVSPDGGFAINRQKRGNVLLSSNLWAEFSGESEFINIKNPKDATVLRLERPNGYPFFLDGRIFLMNSAQNAITQLDGEGRELWRYDFAATITCVDAAAGYLLVGLLDRTIELLDSNGRREFVTELSGSRLAAIYGCAISSNGEKIAVISGRDDQRFVFIERFGAIRRITYHEFLGDGFNRPVQVKFVGGDNVVVYEREDGVGIYDATTRNSSVLPIDGQIQSIGSDGSNDLLFLLVKDGQRQKRLVVADHQARRLISAPFNSEGSFLSRHGNEFYIGGGNILAAFDIKIE